MFSALTVLWNEKQHSLGTLLGGVVNAVDLEYVKCYYGNNWIISHSFMPRVLRVMCRLPLLWQKMLEDQHTNVSFRIQNADVGSLFRNQCWVNFGGISDLILPTTICHQKFTKRGFCKKKKMNLCVSYVHNLKITTSSSMQVCPPFPTPVFLADVPCSTFFRM